MSTLSEEALRHAARTVIDQLAPVSLQTDPVLDALQRYVSSLARFGAHTDLVGARTPQALAEIALADALVIARHPEQLRSPSWEIGAGGASLSVPLALMVPAVTGTLLEPRQKRATFLRMAVGALGLTARLTVSQSRVEPNAVPRGIAGCALSRAVFAPDVWISMAARITIPGGAFLVLTTADLDPPAQYRTLSIERYELPFSRSPRVATWLAE